MRSKYPILIFKHTFTLSICLSMVSGQIFPSSLPKSATLRPQASVKSSSSGDISQNLTGSVRRELVTPKTILKAGETHLWNKRHGTGIYLKGSLSRRVKNFCIVVRFFTSSGKPHEEEFHSVSLGSNGLSPLYVALNSDIKDLNNRLKAASDGIRISDAVRSDDILKILPRAKTVLWSISRNDPNAIFINSEDNALMLKALRPNTIKTEDEYRRFISLTQMYEVLIQKRRKGELTFATATYIERLIIYKLVEVLRMPLVSVSEIRHVLDQKKDEALDCLSKKIGENGRIKEEVVSAIIYERLRAPTSSKARFLKKLSSDTIELLFKQAIPVVEAILAKELPEAGIRPRPREVIDSGDEFKSSSAGNPAGPEPKAPSAREVPQCLIDYAHANYSLKGEVELDTEELLEKALGEGHYISDRLHAIYRLTEIGGAGIIRRFMYSKLYAYEPYIQNALFFSIGVMARAIKESDGDLYQEVRTFLLKTLESPEIDGSIYGLLNLADTSIVGKLKIAKDRVEDGITGMDKKQQARRGFAIKQAIRALEAVACITSTDKSPADKIIYFNLFYHGCEDDPVAENMELRAWISHILNRNNKGFWWYRAYKLYMDEYEQTRYNGSLINAMRCIENRALLSKITKEELEATAEQKNRAAHNWFLAGDALLKANSSKKAIFYFERALALHLELSDKRNVACSLGILGMIFLRLTMLSRASACALHSAMFFEEAGDDGRAVKSWLAAADNLTNLKQAKKAPFKEAAYVKKRIAQLDSDRNIINAVNHYIYAARDFGYAAKDKDYAEMLNERAECVAEASRLLFDNLKPKLAESATQPDEDIILGFICENYTGLNRFLGPDNTKDIMKEVARCVMQLLIKEGMPANFAESAEITQAESAGTNEPKASSAGKGPKSSAALPVWVSSTPDIPGHTNLPGKNDWARAMMPALEDFNELHGINFIDKICDLLNARGPGSSLRILQIDPAPSAYLVRNIKSRFGYRAEVYVISQHKKNGDIPNDVKYIRGDINAALYAMKMNGMLFDIIISTRNERGADLSDPITGPAVICAEQLLANGGWMSLYTDNLGSDWARKFLAKPQHSGYQTQVRQVSYVYRFRDKRVAAAIHKKPFRAPDEEARRQNKIDAILAQRDGQKQAGIIFFLDMKDNGIEKAVEAYPIAPIYYERAKRLAKSFTVLGKTAIADFCWMNSGLYHLKRREFKEAAESFKKSAEINKAPELKKNEARASLFAAKSLYKIEEHKEALSFAERSLELYREMGDNARVSLCLILLSDINFALSRFDDSSGYAIKAAAFHEKIGNMEIAARLWADAGESHVAAGHTLIAARYYTMAANTLRKSKGKMADEAGYRYLAAANYKEAGKLANALLYARDSLRLSRGSGHDELAASSLELLARIHFKLKEYKQAADYAEEAAILSEELNISDLAIERWFLAAHYNSGAGDYSRAGYCNKISAEICEWLEEKEKAIKHYIYAALSFKKASMEHAERECRKKAAQLFADMIENEIIRCEWLREGLDTAKSRKYIFNHMKGTYPKACQFLTEFEIDMAMKEISSVSIAYRYGSMIGRGLRQGFAESLIQASA